MRWINALGIVPLVVIMSAVMARVSRRTPEAPRRLAEQRPDRSLLG
jgi:hypothetical protein